MIYFTDSDPDEAASNLCDQHLRETISFTKKVFKEASEDRIKRGDPYIRWACASLANLKWVVNHGLSATHEIYYRFRKPARLADSLPLIEAIDMVGSIQLKSQYLTPFPDKIDEVRDFYRTKIFRKSRWTRRFPPDWISSSSGSSPVSFVRKSGNQKMR